MNTILLQSSMLFGLVYDNSSLLLNKVKTLLSLHIQYTPY